MSIYQYMFNREKCRGKEGWERKKTRCLVFLCNYIKKYIFAAV